MTAAELADQGVTDLVHRPAGPDIVGELKAFHAALKGRGRRSAPELSDAI